MAGVASATAVGLGAAGRVDDLEVRRGGVAANIAFGMGVLGESPLLIGSVGKDAADYLTWLAEHGVDTSGVRVSETLASPRFTVTTDNDQNQIGAFYPGAMAEAALIELAPFGTLDLVVVAPNDPGAMIRHTAECRDAGVPFVLLLSAHTSRNPCRASSKARDRRRARRPVAVDPGWTGPRRRSFWVRWRQFEAVGMRTIIRSTSSGSTRTRTPSRSPPAR